MKKLFILSEEELSSIIKDKVQDAVDGITESIVRGIAKKSNLNKIDFFDLDEETLSDEDLYSGCGSSSSSSSGCGSSSSSSSYGGGCGNLGGC